MAHFCGKDSPPVPSVVFMVFAPIFSFRRFEMKRTEKVWLVFLIAMILGFFALMAMQQGCQTVEGFGHDIVWTSQKVQEGDRK